MKASSSISCIETLSFLFLLRYGRSVQRRIDPPEAVLICRLWEADRPARDIVFRRRHYFLRYFKLAFPIIPRLITGETDFSRHVDFTGAMNELSWLILQKDVCYRNRQRKRERDSAISDLFVWRLRWRWRWRRIEDFNFETLIEWIATRYSYIKVIRRTRTEIALAKIKILIGIWVIRNKIIIASK